MNATAVNALEFNASKVALGQNYLFVGTDSYLAEKALNGIKSMLKHQFQADTSIVYGDSLSPGELGEILDTFTIFSSNKLIILRNADALKKKDMDVLSDYFDSPLDTQSVAIIIDKIDARLGVWKKVLSSSMRINCDPPKYGGEMKAWLTAELSRQGRSMNPRAMEEFSNRIELDYYTAANELNKISLLAGERKVFTEADVLQSLGTTRTGTLIDFYRALGKKQLRSAMEASEKMLAADWEPLQIFFQIYKFYMILWKIVLLRQKHISDVEISLKHIPEVFTSQKKEYLEFATNYKQDSLAKIMKIMLDTDSQLKSSVIEKKLILCLAITKILEAK